MGERFLTLVRVVGDVAFAAAVLHLSPLLLLRAAVAELGFESSRARSRRVVVSALPRWGEEIRGTEPTKPTERRAAATRFWPSGLLDEMRRCPHSVSYRSTITSLPLWL